RTGLFVITNQFNYAINYQAGRYAAQLKSNGVWYPHPQIHDSWTYGSDWGSEWGLLEPGAWRNVVVAVPYDATIWRATVRTLRVPYWRVVPPYEPYRTNYSLELVNELHQHPAKPSY